LPIIVVGVLSRVAPHLWGALLLVDVAALAVVAWRRWSPLVVLGLSALVFVSFVGLWFVGFLFDSCGDAHGASLLKGFGAAALALTIGTWGVHGGRRTFWALPAGVAAAAVWIALVAHLWPGASGSCLR
jgi:hypothetical protein